jgi:hypothetical protein
MKDKLNGHRLGMVLGGFMVIVHVIWVLAIWLGIGQAWLDLIFRLHMLNNPMTVQAINWGNAIMLWVVVWIVGYILGYIFAWVHNFVHKK